MPSSVECLVSNRWLYIIHECFSYLYGTRRPWGHELTWLLIVGPSKAWRREGCLLRSRVGQRYGVSQQIRSRSPIRRLSHFAAPHLLFLNSFLSIAFRQITQRNEWSIWNPSSKAKKHSAGATPAFEEASFLHHSFCEPPAWFPLSTKCTGSDIIISTRVS